MSLTASDKGGGFTLAPAGQHRARCFGVIDLGTQKVEWQGQVKWQPKVMLRWELSDELMEADEHGKQRPFSISKRYTNSLHEKAALRHDLEAWRGKQFTGEELAGFNLSKLLKAPCQLTVVHEQGKNGSTYANIKAIAPLAKGMQAPPECANEPVMYDISEGTGGAYQKFSDKLKETIAACQEWQGRGAVSSEAPGSDQKPGATEDEDNIPF